MPKLKRMDLPDPPNNSNTIPTLLLNMGNHFEDFKLTLENIKEKIPIKCRGDTIKLLAIFYNNQLGKDLKHNKHF